MESACACVCVCVKGDVGGQQYKEIDKETKQEQNTYVYTNSSISQFELSYAVPWPCAARLSVSNGFTYVWLLLL